MDWWAKNDRPSYRFNRVDYMTGTCVKLGFQSFRIILRCWVCSRGAKYDLDVLSCTECEVVFSTTTTKKNVGSVRVSTRVDLFLKTRSY